MNYSANNNFDNGVLDLSFKNLDHNDLKQILTKLGSSCGDHTPGRCRRIITAHDDVESRIRAVWKLRFAGNPDIGDEGMKYLSLIPDSVRDVDFGECNLSCEGIKTVCEFLAKNKTLTRVFLGGNGMNDEAAKAVGQMLSENDTLQELCIDPRRESPEEQGSIHVRTNDNNCVSWIAAIKVCMGLYHNRTLRHLHFTVPNFSATDEAIWYLMFAKMLHDDSPLETLECGSLSKFHDLPSYLYSLLETVCDKWVTKLETNQQIHSISGKLLKLFRANEIQYYLDLNQCHARRIVRDPNSSSSEWLESVTCASKEHKLNALYYLIRNKPEVCKL